MLKKKRKPEEINTSPIDEDQVRLPYLLGIRPGVYLALLYGLVLLAIVFFVTLYPGISNPGTVLALRSEPAGAAVRVDGVYMDAAPCEIFVPKGSHTVDVVLPGFDDWSDEIEFGGAVFCSLFFPKKLSLNVELESSNPRRAFIDSAAEFTAWSFHGDATAAAQVPMPLSAGAYRLGPYAAEPAVRQGMEKTLAAAARFAVTQTALRDLLRAKFLLDSKGLAPSPLTLLGSTRGIIGFLEQSPGAADWLAETLPAEAASVVKSSPWKAEPAALFTAAQGVQTETFGGLLFREIVISGAADALNTASATARADISSFLIAETPVPDELWERFLEETPEWRAENRAELAEKGLVDSQYLAYSYFPGMPENAAAWISWYAARAWCEWYGARTGLTVRLPLEAEWELAVETGFAETGDFWEWCEEPFVPLDFLPAPPPASDPGSPERPVRGGSWINPPQSVNADTRGSLSPDSCSPFVSFRPVIAEKKD